MYLTVNLLSQNVAANTSTFEAFVTISGVPSSTNRGDPVAVSISGIGAQISGTFNWPSGSTSRRILYGTRTVSHAADGTLGLSVSAAINATGTTGIGGPTSMGSYWLPVATIPRASTPSIPASTVIGSPMTINTNRASSSFTHTITYSFGSASGTIATGVGTSFTWTPPESLLTQIPNTTSGTGTITLTTYSGGTNVGSRSVTMTLTAGPTVLPTFDTVTHSETNTTVSSLVGRYVQGLSRLSLAITGATGAHGSTITASRIEVGGQVLSSASGTMPTAINSSGAVPIVATVTDSRGRTATKTVTIDVLAYQPPRINSWSATRASSTGAPDNDGTYLRINLNTAVQSLINTTQRNTLRYVIKTSIRGEENWETNADVTLPVGTLAFNSGVTVGTYAVSSAYDVVVEVHDKFTGARPTQVATTVGTSAVLMHYGTGGVGLGKYWEQGSVDAAGQMFQNGGKPVMDSANLIGHLPNRNLIINGNFRTNQREYVSGASLAVGAFGFDRWKATTAATALTYTAAPQGQTVTIGSGKSIAQVVERANVLPGTYVLSWEGTAVGRVYNSGTVTPPAYAEGPLTVAIDGTKDVVVEFQASGAVRTLGRVQLEVGTAPTPYEQTNSTTELLMCQRYYHRVLNGQMMASNPYFSVGLSAGDQFIHRPHPVPMYRVPTLLTENGTENNLYTFMYPLSNAGGNAFYALNLGVTTDKTIRAYYSSSNNGGAVLAANRAFGYLSSAMVQFDAEII